MADVDWEVGDVVRDGVGYRNVDVPLAGRRAGLDAVSPLLGGLMPKSWHMEIVFPEMEPPEADELRLDAFMDVLAAFFEGEGLGELFFIAGSLREDEG